MNMLGFLFNITLVQAMILALGLVLVILEMFIPGVGVPGITGGILIFIGIFLIAKSFTQALLLLLIILLLLSAALILAVKSFRKGHLYQKLVLKHSQKKETGYVGSEELGDFLGKEGLTITILRPAGTVDFDGVYQDAVSEGNFIPAGSRVKVIKVEGRRMVVRKV